ncbi:site-specific integrase [Rhizobium ruizarguesonis]|uniref:hypothetical protein n=1 Tax=Rhizobium ruizarguesonis TaxID=2081791 RepID=UPI0013EE639B|nr:hypothetical protein [Rhizobium ruizarguesonis]
MSVLKVAIDRSKVKESDWAFPSEDGPEKHVGRSATLGVVKRLAARDHFAKSISDEERTDLFAINGFDYWSPHDLRRTLTEVMDDAGMPGGASALLAHTLDAGSERSMTDAQFADWMKNKIAEITRDSYGDIQHLGLKCDAMLVWTNSVLDAWETARSNGVYIDKHKTSKARAPIERSPLRPVSADL